MDFSYRSIAQHTLDCKSRARFFFFQTIIIVTLIIFLPSLHCTDHHYISTPMGLNVLPTFLHSFPFFHFIDLDSESVRTNHHSIDQPIRVSFLFYIHIRGVHVLSVIFQLLNVFSVQFVLALYSQLSIRMLVYRVVGTVYPPILVESFSSILATFASGIKTRNNPSVNSVLFGIDQTSFDSSISGDRR